MGVAHATPLRRGWCGGAGRPFAWGARLQYDGVGRPCRGGEMDADQKVCLCFHVTRRKLLNFLRVERPRVASQLSECGGAGTGCGWCVPFLKEMFRQAVAGGTTELEQLTPEE